MAGDELLHFFREFADRDERRLDIGCAPGA
jgi:hypothetical protein